MSHYLWCFPGPFQQFIACDNRTQLPALFQNIFKCCTFSPKFWNILPFFALFKHFFWPFICPFSEKRMPLLCRIGPDYYCQGGRKLSPTSLLLSSNYGMLSASSSTNIFIQINQYNSMRRSFQWTFAVYRIGAKSELVLKFQNIFK